MVLIGDVCSPEHCRGCRRIQNSECKYTFEVIFANGPPLELSASNALDERSWLMAICNAVSNPSGVSSSYRFIYFVRPFLQFRNMDLIAWVFNRWRTKV